MVGFTNGQLGLVQGPFQLTIVFSVIER